MRLSAGRFHRARPFDASLPREALDLGALALERELDEASAERGSPSGSGMRRIVRSGFAIRKKTERLAPSAPMKIVSRRPTHSASMPPTTLPSGIVPLW
jgi:hypothetical protein